MLTTGGTLTVMDVDSPASFVAGRHGVRYGTFTINSAGAWTYTREFGHNEFVAGNYLHRHVRCDFRPRAPRRR